MSDSAPPKIGEWFKTDTDETFEVVAYDKDDGTIEIQYFDGTVEELDLDTWHEMEIESTQPPEDWSGSYDIQREDYGVDLGFSNDDRVNPLDLFD